MDGNVLKEIYYLTRLIEQHKRKSPEKSLGAEKIFSNQESILPKSEKRTNLIHRSQQLSKTSREGLLNNSTNVKCQMTSTNVYVNPNFKPQNPVIHINPKVCVKPLVHVNPKMMKDVAKLNDAVEMKPPNTTSNVEQNVQTDVKRSVYVNPNLMKKLSSATESKPSVSKQITAHETARPICSRLKFVKNTNSPKLASKKTSNPGVVILSRRKLIRIRRGSRGSSNITPISLSKTKKSSVSPYKKVKVTPTKVIKAKIMDTLQHSTIRDCSVVKLPAVKAKINKYRIDRTVPESTKIKKCTTLNSKKTHKTMELITIGGIVYKSSKNQLVRRSYGLKKKRTTNIKTDKFIVATNGNKLCRLRSAKEIRTGPNNSTVNTINGTKLLFNVSQKANYKNNISNKVKQRSIQILRNKMRKNNQPCLIFQRFGYCANHQKGTCPKLHDKKQISLCKKFLQGNCLLDKCPLSHDVGPEKMPTCKYFLEGCCTRDNCPYRHIKVSSSTPICIEFLKGYCAKGHECKRRHENLCPEFVKTGNCSKGKYCPYPHKPHTPAAIKQTVKYLKRKHAVTATPVMPATEEVPASSENRLRYYQQTGTLTKDLDKKRESVLKKIKLMKSIEVAVHSDNVIAETFSEKDDTDSTRTTVLTDNDVEIISETKTIKRPPIGSLPAYIPIN